MNFPQRPSLSTREAVGLTHRHSTEKAHETPANRHKRVCPASRHTQDTQTHGEGFDGGCVARLAGDPMALEANGDGAALALQGVPRRATPCPRISPGDVERVGFVVEVANAGLAAPSITSHGGK